MYDMGFILKILVMETFSIAYYYNIKRDHRGIGKVDMPQHHLVFGTKSVHFKHK